MRSESEEIVPIATTVIRFGLSSDNTADATWAISSFWFEIPLNSRVGVSSPKSVGTHILR